MTILEGTDIIKVSYKGEAGSHEGARVLTGKAFRIGFY